jgi:hypothetical protein
MKCLIVITVLAIMCARGASADGGVPIISLQGAHGRCTLVMEPAQPVVGPVAFEVIGAGDDPVQLTLVEAGADVATPVALAPDAAMGHWRGVTRFDADGPCDITLVWGDHARGTARVSVAPPPAPWQVQWPWLVAWIAPGALLVLRQRSLRRRIYTARTPHV